MASLMLSVSVLGAAMWSLYGRYYGFSNTQITDVQCGAETVWRDEYIGEVYFPSNIKGSMFFNGTTRSDEKARSGHYSAKLSEQANYTFTYKLYNIRGGDTIHAEVWCWGAVGNLWLVSPKNKLFLAENKPIETDSAG